LSATAPLPARDVPWAEIKSCGAGDAAPGNWVERAFFAAVRLELVAGGELLLGVSPFVEDAPHIVGRIDRARVG